MCITTTPAATIAAPQAPQFDDQRTLLPLPSQYLSALPLSADEARNGAVFILERYYSDEHTPEAQCVSRLAVCRPIPLAELGQLAAGSIVIYSALDYPSEDEQPSLNSNAGVVKLNDPQRQVLYTVIWEGRDNEERDHDYKMVYEAWQVQRFISLHPAN